MSLASKFESVSIAQLVQVELLRRHFVDPDLGQLLVKFCTFELEPVYTASSSKVPIWAEAKAP